jgi:hypothetical protein
LFEGFGSPFSVASVKLAEKAREGAAGSGRYWKSTRRQGVRDSPAASKCSRFPNGRGRIIIPCAGRRSRAIDLPVSPLLKCSGAACSLVLLVSLRVDGSGVGLGVDAWRLGKETGTLAGAALPAAARPAAPSGEESCGNSGEGAPGRDEGWSWCAVDSSEATATIGQSSSCLLSDLSWTGPFGGGEGGVGLPWTPCDDVRSERGAVAPLTLESSGMSSRRHDPSGVVVDGRNNKCIKEGEIARGFFGPGDSPPEEPWLFEGRSLESRIAPGKEKKTLEIRATRGKEPTRQRRRAP